jgi:hypothetical protein
MTEDIIEGGCYCGQVRYRAQNRPLLKAECYCRQCQYITGGAPVLIMAVPAEGYEQTGETTPFTHPDWPHAVTREFCPKCGTHLLTRAPGFPQGVILKVGGLDDPSIFGEPDFAAWAQDAQPYHRLPSHIPVHQKWPGVE